MKKAAFVFSMGLIAALLISRPELRTAADSESNNRSLAEQIVIRRDTYGVPHILAETEEAASFGMGYAQAEDHCEEIARRFIGARGEAAKFFGTWIEDDFRMKQFRNYEIAGKSFERLSPLFQRMMNAYAAGFNLYVEKNRGKLPAWIPKFDGIDVLARGRAEVMRFAFNDSTIGAVRTKYPAGPERRSIEPGSMTGHLGYAPEHQHEDPGGSNMWALAGSRTDSGKPILLGNPHQPWAALYWEAHVTVPGKINFFGGTFVGRPVLTTGFNENLGWTHTVNYPDLDDIYMLTLDPEKPDRYIFEGKSTPLARREVTVEVRNSDGSFRTEKRTYWDSHLGPIVHRTANKAFAIKSAIFDAFRYYEEWYSMGKSKNLTEFLDNLRMNVIPMFNLCYADVEGNILYLWNGTVPKRIDDGMDYRLDVPGDTSKYVWNGFHKTGELPQLLNPEGGYVQNCNDPPWWTSLRSLLDPKKYPSYFEPGRQLGLRTQISLEMLESRPKFSLEDVKRLKYNTRMLLADRIKPDLLQAIRAVESPSEDLRRGLVLLEAWDNMTSAASRGAVLFQRFWDTYRMAAKRPFATAWDRSNPAATPRGIGERELAVKHFEEAVRWTREKYGSEAVAWGEVHRMRMGDIDLAGDGAGGEYGLFRVAHYSGSSDGKRVMGTGEKGRPMAGGGDGWIMAVEFGKPIVAYSVLAYGETSNPVSRHSTDQLRLFANHQFKRVWFTEAEIRANLERSYRPGE